MEIIGAMLKIVLAMALGFLLYRLKILNDNSNEVMSKLISMGIAPCMTFASIVTLEAGRKEQILILLAAGVGVYILLALLAYVSARIINPGKQLQGVYEATLTFGNTAFLGFPIAQALMGNLGVSYLAILNMHQNIFAWSLGVFQLTKGNEGAMKFSGKKLLNPPIIASILGVVLYLAGVRVPDIVMVPIDFIAQTCSPLSMIVIGSTIASYSLKELFIKPRHYLLAALKLVVFPLIVFGVSLLIFGAGDIAKAIAIHCMMPTAVIISMAAMIYKADYKTTTSVTGLMDILCIGTIPAMWAIIGLFG